jgi:hypothetical protein
MKFFAKKKAVAQTEGNLNAMQLTEEQVAQVAAGCNDIGPIGGLFNFGHSGSQPSAPKHQSGGNPFANIHIMGI